MALSDIFSFASRSSGDILGNVEVPSLFPLNINAQDFIKADIIDTFKKILSDVIERTQGIDGKFEVTLWDNCIQSEASSGLVSLLAHAMTEQKDLFLVYASSVNLLRVATNEEEKQIKEDYKSKGESALGVYVSFKTYGKVDRLKIYSMFEYCILNSLNKTLNVSKALQIKVNDLRASVSVADAPKAIEQAQAIAEALKNGSDVIVDRQDDITTTKPDTEIAEKAINFLYERRSEILGLPLAYVKGEQTGGMGASGENDTKAIERGLKLYYVSIIRPVLKALFKIETSYKSQDFRQFMTGMELLKTFALEADEYMTRESKIELICQAFNIDVTKAKKALGV